MLWRVENWNPDVARQCRQTEPSLRLARVLELAHEAGLVLPELDLPGLEHLLEIYRINALAHVKYRPDPCRVPLTLFRAADGLDGSDLQLGWTSLALGGVEVVVVPGRHETLIGPAFARGFARELETRMQRNEAAVLPSLEI